MRQRGFTLVEVMLALAILFAGLVVLIKSTAENIATAQEAHALGVATDLARGKMYDIEEILLDEGFQEMDQELDGEFDEEGWPNYRWEAVIEKIELPAMNALSGMDAAGEEGAQGSANTPGSALGGLGGMFGLGAMGGMGGGQGGDPSSMATGNFIASQFELLSQVLEASIRKVTLTVHWKLLGDDQELSVVCYFTAPAAMNQVIATGGLPTSGTGSSSGSSSGSGSEGSSRGSSSSSGITSGSSSRGGK